MIPAVALLAVFLAACGSREEDRARAEDFCSRKAVQVGVPLARVYQPSREEASRGYDAFMRECMKNQGY